MEQSLLTSAATGFQEQPLRLVMAVSGIDWSTPGGVAQNICGILIPCGLNPLFSFDLPVSDPCADTVFTVTAFTADGDSASITRSFHDTVPPVLAVGADKTVECGSLWDL